MCTCDCNITLYTIYLVAHNIHETRILVVIYKLVWLLDCYCQNVELEVAVIEVDYR